MDLQYLLTIEEKNDIIYFLRKRNVEGTFERWTYKDLRELMSDISHEKIESLRVQVMHSKRQ